MTARYNDQMLQKEEMMKTYVQCSSALLQRKYDAGCADLRAEAEKLIREHGSNIPRIVKDEIRANVEVILSSGPPEPESGYMLVGGDLTQEERRKKGLPCNTTPGSSSSKLSKKQKARLAAQATFPTDVPWREHEGSEFFTKCKRVDGPDGLYYYAFE